MFETISEGFVNRRPPESALPVAAGPRLAVTAAGEVLCTFMVQSALGINDFVPVLTRSADLGATWTEPVPLFPALQGAVSLFGSIGPGQANELFFCGIRIPVDRPGESFWSDATQGMKQNSLFWSRSVDGGAVWSDPREIPLDGPGSAEATCPLAVTRRGRWLACYSPYNSFDPAVQVDRGRVVVACSDDQGATWFHRDVLRFAEPDSGGAEAWVVELADGRLLATCWHVDHTSSRQYPNAFAVSDDGGDRWTPTLSTGTLGQSTSLTPLAGPGGNAAALFVYNQRKQGQPGIRIAPVHPTQAGFGAAADQLVWAAPMATQHGTSAEHAEWTDFSFGEPAVAVLPDGTCLLVFWCIQPTGSGIRFVKMRRRS